MAREGLLLAQLHHILPLEVAWANDLRKMSVTCQKNNTKALSLTLQCNCFAMHESKLSDVTVCSAESLPSDVIFVCLSHGMSSLYTN